MKERTRMMNVAMNNLERCNMELKSIMNHSEGLSPDVLAEINRIYYELGELYSGLENLEGEL